MSFLPKGVSVCALLQRGLLLQVPVQIALQRVAAALELVAVAHGAHVQTAQIVLMVGALLFQVQQRLSARTPSGSS